MENVNNQVVEIQAEETVPTIAVSEDLEAFVSSCLAQEQDRDDLVYLPIGLRFKGNVVRLIQIKEPDGFTEEAQTDTNFRKHFTTIIDATLMDCIVGISGLDKPKDDDKWKELKLEFVRQLSEPDRQYLLLRLYRIQHGDMFQFQAQCRHCGSQNDIEKNIREDIKINFVNDAHISPSQDDRFILRDVKLPYPITVGDKQFDVVNVRIPNGNMALALEKCKNEGLTVTKLIFNMLLVNQDRFIASETDVKKWSKKIRNGIVEAVGEVRRGFVNEYNHTCDECGKEFKAVYPVGAFLGK